MNARIDSIDTPVNSDQPSDFALFQQITDGNARALGLLYDRHAPLMYSVLVQKLGNTADAQDIVHDVFIKLYSRGVSYNAALGKPISWLLTVARNQAIDLLRRKSVQQKYLHNNLMEAESPPADPPPAGADEITLLQGCIAILPNQQRQTLDLAYFSGLTQQEIAEKLTQPLGTIKAWIRRGLIKLKLCMEGK